MYRLLKMVGQGVGEMLYHVAATFGGVALFHMTFHQSLMVGVGLVISCDIFTIILQMNKEGRFFTA
jgi:hypothetical protein